MDAVEVWERNGPRHFFIGKDRRCIEEHIRKLSQFDPNTIRGILLEVLFQLAGDDEERKARLNKAINDVTNGFPVRYLGYDDTDSNRKSGFGRKVELVNPKAGIL